MPGFNVEVSNPLGKSAGTTALKTFLEKVKERYQGQVSNLVGNWSDNVLDFSFTAYGFEIKGKLTVEDSVATVNGELPFVAMMFQGRIEQTIKDEISKVLNGKPAS